MISQAKYTLTEVLRHRWWIGGVAFGVALICTPMVRAVAYRRRIVDRPDDLLKPHAKPVAYLGGVAICLGLLTGLAAYVSIMPEAGRHWAAIRRCLFSPQYCELVVNPLWNVIAIGAASVVITLVGLLDDLADVRPRTKVLGQVLAAAILLVGGVGNRMILVFFEPFGAAPGDWLVLPLSVLMCLVTVIAACNATNLLDGLDGLCGGVTGIIAIGFLAVATWLAMWGGPSPGTDELRVVLCLAMAGAVFGFLPYNIPPASIFMGDAGSMLLGFFVATAMALFCAEGVARWFLAALAVFSLPILDTALAVVRRVLSKRNIFAGDRSHLYDQLVDRGMTVKQVVALFYVLALLAVGVGVGLAIFVRARYAVLIYAALLALIWAAFWKLGMIRPAARKPFKPDRGAPPSD